MKYKLRPNWQLGFLGLMEIRGVIGIINENWMESIWIVWFSWFTAFIPEKKENN